MERRLPSLRPAFAEGLDRQWGMDVKNMPDLRWYIVQVLPEEMWLLYHTQ